MDENPTIVEEPDAIAAYIKTTTSALRDELDKLEQISMEVQSPTGQPLSEIYALAFRKARAESALAQVAAARDLLTAFTKGMASLTISAELLSRRKTASLLGIHPNTLEKWLKEHSSKKE